MSEAPKRPSKGQRAQDRDNPSRSNRSPIKAPPRVALGQGRPSKPKDETHEQSSSSAEKPRSRTPSRSQSQTQASPSRISLAERVKQLEEELRVMEEAFRTEHEQLAQQAIDESERAAVAKERYSDVHKDFLNKDTELKMLLVDFERQVGDVERKTRYECELRYRQERKLLEDVLLEKRVEVLRMAEENSKLQRQILGLKEFVSTNTRTEGQVTDDVVAMRAKKLDGDLQNWVISNFRRVSLDFAAVSDSCLQSLSMSPSIKHHHHSIPKVRFLQSIFSHILSSNIFSLYFVGLDPERAAELEVIEAFMSTISDTSAVNTWRSTTLGLIRRAPHSTLATAIATFIDDLIHRIEYFLADLGVPSSPPRTDALRPILLEAVELAQLFRVQKARLELCTFENEGEENVEFDEEVMEDVGGEDEGNGREGCRVLCVVSPAVVKYGDEEGGESYLRNVIVKGKVLLEG